MADPSDNPTPTRQTQWSRFLIEGGVIVASILLAFGIQAWWEGRQEAQLERQALETLLQEAAQLESLMDRVAATHQAIGEAGQYLLGAIADPEERSADSVATAVHRIDGMTTMTFELTSFDLLINSGTLDVLSDPTLAQDLWMLDTLLEVYGRFEDREESFIQSQLDPFYDQQIDRGLDRTQRRVNRRSRWYATRGIREVELRRFPIDYTELLGDPVFSNLVHRRHNLMMSLDEFLPQIRDVLPEVVSAAETILAR